jgi:hypothetical protein
LKDTLQAEGGKELTALIAPFREGKSIHNDQSLSALWHVDRSVVPRFVQVLTDVGFLEQTSEGYRVPPLYQAGLKMTAGRAFGI